MPTEEELEARMEETNAAITAQGGKVRALKDAVKSKKKRKEDAAAVEAQVMAAVEELKALKASLEDLEEQMEQVTGVPRNKEAFQEAVKNALEGRMFYKQSFSIYGGVSGLYDYGPPGTAVKAAATQLWRQHFVLHESMLELECPAITPEPVLRASGHVDRFQDWMVRDELHNCLRADHLLEAKLEAIIADARSSRAQKDAARADLAVVGEMGGDTLGAKLRAYSCVSSEPGGGAVSDPFPFNLMFKTSIGPTGTITGYLRPETAQGIFVNFRDLLYYNGGRLPFAAAQIGQSFRNEINPKQGLLRVREFTQAEIEHFVHPDRKGHPRFGDVAALAPLMYSAALQQGSTRRPEHMRLGDAVANGVVANETLAYFIGRTHLFMLALGLDPKRVMYRQHLPNEMAHYACDCWDCEVLTTYGWIECAGLADRSAYDLTQHSAAAGVELVAYEQYEEPRMEEVVEVVPQMKVMGKALKGAAKDVAAHLAALGADDALALKARLGAEGAADIELGSGSVKVTPDMVTINEVTRKVHGYNYTPSVIEPSFGIGRVLYCMFEHTFYTRPDDEQKSVFRLKPWVAPIKATVFPLLQRQELNEVAHSVSLSLRRAGIASLTDNTGTTIGKRYARTDELGVPFALTVDYDTLSGGQLKDTVTLRERDTTAQVRVPIADVCSTLRSLCDPLAEVSWDDIQQKYPAQVPPSED